MDGLDWGMVGDVVTASPSPAFPVVPVWGEQCAREHPANRSESELLLLVPDALHEFSSNNCALMQKVEVPPNRIELLTFS